MFKRTVWILVLWLMCEENLCRAHLNIHHPQRSRWRRDSEKTTASKRSIALVDEDFDIPPADNAAKEYDGTFHEFQNFLDGSGDSDQDTEETKKPLTSSGRSRAGHVDMSDTSSISNSISSETNMNGKREQADMSENSASFSPESFLNRKEADIGERSSISNSTSPEHNTNGGQVRTSETLLFSSSQQTHSASYKPSTDIATDVPFSISISESTIRSSVATEGREISDNVMASSGDGASTLIQESTTELTTKAESQNPFDPVTTACWNNICEKSNLQIQSLEVNVVPEGTNLTITCKSNTSDYHILYWYKGNGSSHFEQTFGINRSLNLHVPDAKISHSGTYRCVKWVDEEFCCSRHIHIKVYEVPHYIYHIIIIALLAATLLIALIWLQVRQRKNYAMYTKEFTTKHGNVNEQLLWN